jgi:hypothetical protein
MIMFKIVATFLLLWFAAGIVGLIFNSQVSPRFLTSLTACCAAALTYFLWLV